jgi:hypothetical protein
MVEKTPGDRRGRVAAGPVPHLGAVERADEAEAQQPAVGASGQLQIVDEIAHPALVVVAEIHQLGGDGRRVLRQHANHDLGVIAAIEQHFQVGRAGRFEPRPGGAPFGHGGIHMGGDALHPFRVYREQQRFLGVEMVVDRTRQHSGGAGHVPHGGGVVAPPGKEFRGGVENGLAPVVLARRAGWSGCGHRD